MFDERAVPGWVLVGIVLSVIPACVAIVLIPGLQPSTLLVIAAPLVLLWAGLAVYNNVRTDPEIQAERLRNEEQLIRTSEKSSQPILNEAKRLLKVNKPAEISAALSAVLEENRQLKNRLNEATTRKAIEALEARKSRLAEETQAAEAKVSKLDAKVKESTQLIAKRTAEAQTLQSDLGRLSNDIGHKRKELKQVQDDLKKAREAKQKIAADEQELKRRVEMLTTERSSCTESLLKQQQQISDLENRIVHLRSECETFEAQSDERQSALAEISEHLDALNQLKVSRELDLEKLNAKLEAEQGKLLRVASELEEANGQRSAAQREHTRLLDEIEWLSRQEAEKRPICEALHAEQFSLSTIVERLKLEQDALLEVRDKALIVIEARAEAERRLAHLNTQIAMREANARELQNAKKIPIISRAGKQKFCAKCAEYLQRLHEVKEQVVELNALLAARDQGRELEDAVWSLLQEQEPELLERFIALAENSRSASAPTPSVA